MINQINKNEQRKKRHLRVRKTVSGTAKCPRLNVYRSTSHIYAQLIDDHKQTTIASASTVEKSILAQLKGKTKTQQASIIGQEIAKRAGLKKIKTVVFDRGGYLYTGRVRALADGARAGGLEF